MSTQFPAPRFPRSILPTLTGTLFAFACVTWLLAGPLNPPSGPVTAGGKTTQQIFDAVTANSQATGAIGAKGPAVPGADFTRGSISATVGGVPVSSPILGVRTSFAAPTTVGPGGTNVGFCQVESFTVVREMSTGGTPFWKAITTGTSIPTTTITIPCAGGTTVYLLTNTFILGQRHSNIQRADGSFAAIEEIDLLPITVQQTEPSGAHWQWNFATRAGT